MKRALNIQTITPIINLKNQFMNFKTKFFGLLMAALVATGLYAQKPYVGCWHPDDIRNWSPETDADAIFNKSTVKLQPRFQDPSIMANQYQHYEGQVCNSTILHHQCSTYPSQGEDNFIGYNPTYWQYMDLVVFWGGSAGEGIIVPPSAPCIDVAHMNGVRILGQIFFPPGAFGGNSAWPQTMLGERNAEGKLHFAKKLYEITAYMGFDGWFINQETPGGGSGGDWAGFIKDFQYYAEQNGDDMEIQYYNASGGYDSYVMDSHVSSSQFLEYGSPSSCQSQMSSLIGRGFTREEAFKKLYFGVQCVYAGLTGAGGSLRTLYGENQHHGSIDLFCPEERIWKDPIKEWLYDESKQCGEGAYNAQKQVFKNEKTFWVNRVGDPSNTNDRNGWPGFSNCIAERSVLTYKPFVTSFSSGMGKHRFYHGQIKGTHDWYHRGMQNIMPTWRWWIENNASDQLTVNVNWDDAYNIGSSFKVTGALSAGQDHLTRMFKTHITVESGDIFRFVYKTNTPNSMQIKLATVEDDNAFTTLTQPTQTQENGWTVEEYDLSALNGKTVSMIALNFRSESQVASYETSLGLMGILSANYENNVPAVSNIHEQYAMGMNGGDLRLIWDLPEDISNIDHYDIYLQQGDQEKVLVGQTRNQAFFIPNVERISVDVNFAKVSIVSIAKDFNEGQTATYNVEFPHKTAPVVTFKAGKTELLVGEETTIEARATWSPSQYEWTLPEGLELKSTSEDQSTITVKAVSEGFHTVQVAATNDKGTTVHSARLIDVVSSYDLTNLALNKEVIAYSGSTNDREHPRNLFNGVTNTGDMGDKWCEIAQNHFVTVDLGGVYRLYSFKFYDCGVNEGGSNMPNYRIKVSADGETWTKVVDETNRNENIKEDYITPAEARYVRFEPYGNGVTTLRIWEFEAYGKSASNMTLSTPETIKVNSDETQLLEVSYALNGDERKDEFHCTATIENASLATIGEITEDEANHKFIVKVTGKKAIGATRVVATVHNGAVYCERKIALQVDDPSAQNFLLGETVTVRTFDNTWSEQTVATLTDGNTTDNGLGVEDESWEAYDREIVYTAETAKNLAKFNVSFVDANVLKMKVSLSKDGSYYKEYKTFDVAEAGDLTYIMPETKNCKYIKFAFDIEPGEIARIAEVAAYEQTGVIPTFIPLTITNGFNEDVIAESKPCKDYSSHGLDDDGWVFFSSDVREQGALCAADACLTTTSNVNYQLAPLNSNNAALLWNNGDIADVEFEENIQAQKVYVLASASNGNTNVEVTLQYADGTSSEAQTFEVLDWYENNAGNAQLAGLSKTNRESVGGWWSSTPADSFEGTNYCMFEGVIEADASKTLASISVKNTSGAHLSVFAITAKGIFASSGDGIEENNATIKNRINVFPVPVANGQVLHVEAGEGNLVKIISLQGVVIAQEEAVNNIVDITIHNYAPGVYLVAVQKETGVQVERILVK
jgi:endo-beta-N-acetylglucosaminidase D